MAPETTGRPPHRRRERLWLGAIAAAAILAYLFHAISYVWFFYDDTFISMRYAENLLRHGALVYNPGDPVEGFSNLLWTLQLALAGWLGLPLLSTARAMGLAEAAGLFVLGLAFLQRIFRELGARPRARLAGALALGVGFACCNLLAAHAQSGMETVQHALLLALAFLAAARVGRAERPWTLAVAAGAMVLVILNRPEGFGYYPFFIGALLLGAPRRRELLRRRWPLLGLPLLTLGLLTAWRMWNYGLPLPLSVFAKLGLKGEAWGGLSDIGEFLTYGGCGWYYIVLAPLVAYLFLPRRGLPGWARAQLGALLLLIAANWLFVIKTGGDVLNFSRFLVPSILPLALLLAAAVTFYADRVGAATGLGRVANSLALLAVAGLGGALALGQAGNLVHGVDFFTRQSTSIPKQHFWSATSRWLREGKWLGPIPLYTGYGGLILPFWLDEIMPGQSVVIGDIGMPGMIGDQVRIIDSNGLVDPCFAHVLQAAPGTEDFKRRKGELFAHLDRLRPDWLFLVSHSPSDLELYPGLSYLDWPGAGNYEKVLLHQDWGETLEEPAPKRYLTVLRRYGMPLPTAAGVRQNYERFRAFFANAAETDRIYRDWEKNAAAGPLCRMLWLDPSYPEQNKVEIAGATLRGVRLLGQFDDARTTEGWRFSGALKITDQLRPADRNGRYPFQGFVGRGLLNSARGQGGEHPETGEALSGPFVARGGDYLGFLIGGGCAEGTGVALLVDGREERTWHGFDSGRLRFVLADLAPYVGRTVRIKVFDHTRGPFGFVLADQFVILRKP